MDFWTEVFFYTVFLLQPHASSQCTRTFKSVTIDKVFHNTNNHVTAVIVAGV